MTRDHPAELAQQLSVKKNELIAIINAERDKRIAGTVQYLGSVFDTDRDAQQNITGAAVLAQLALAQGAAFNIDWVTYSNDPIALDAMGVIELGQVVAQHKSAKIIEARNYKDAILNAATAEVAQAVFNEYMSLS